MPIRTLTETLDSRQVKYVTISHSCAYTAQEIAAEAHVSGRKMAKVVMVKLDGQMAMVVVSAVDKVDLKLVRGKAEANHVELASEDEFAALFPGVETGAMPPFGNLFGIPVYVDESLGDDPEITFNAGSHTELMRLSYAEFAAIVDPILGRYAAGAWDLAV